MDIVDISDLGVFGFFGGKLGPKNVRNFHFCALLRTFWSLLRTFEHFLSAKIVETKFNKGGMSALRAFPRGVRRAAGSEKRVGFGSELLMFFYH